MKNIKLMNIINAVFILLYIALINIFFIRIPENPTYEPPYETDENWALFLIDTENPLPSGYLPDLKTVYTDKKSGREYQLDSRCAESAVQMIQDAEKNGIMLSVCSAYRSFEKQEENFSDYVNHLIGMGYTEQQAVEITEKQIAYPGESEHNAGLSMDIVTENWFDTHTEVTAEFENTAEFKWLIKNSYKYGFIMRYPKGSENIKITGFDYEPWHYRFVGTEHAEQIYFMGATLEEYIENYYDNR